MKHYFPDVPNRGNFAVSRHAQEQLVKDKITEETFEHVLYTGRIIPDAGGVEKIEGAGITIVVLLRPEPFRGAKLVKTVYRTKAQATARR